MSLGGLACVAAGFAAGFAACLVAWGVSGRAGGVDPLRRPLAEIGLARMRGLPEPTDAEVEAMVAAAVQAPPGAPFAWWTLALAAALLRAHRRSVPGPPVFVDNSPPHCG